MAESPFENALRFADRLDGRVRATGPTDLELESPSEGECRIRETDQEGSSSIGSNVKLLER